MSNIEITVAMATYDDHSGVFFSSQALRMYHDMQNVEILVLDNNPNGPHGRDVKGYCENASRPDAPLRYVPFDKTSGTTQTRQELFNLAQGEIVLVMDCHVLLQANAIHNLKQFWKSASPEMKKNLFTGPLIYDNLGWLSTHFECEWRDQMWGTWATAWLSPDGVHMVGRPVDGHLEMKVLNSQGPWMKSGIPFPRHEDVLKARGFKPVGWDNDESPFEIPAQGLGLFISSKEHWLGFNPDFKHFGGEECYIHEKYRQAGRKTFCLPFMKWNHRFGRPEGPKYRISREGKLRNYILGFQELGLPLAPVKEHFVQQGVAPEMVDAMIADPVPFDVFNNPWIRPNTDIDNQKPQMLSNNGMKLPFESTSLPIIAVEVSTYERDLNRHAETLVNLSADCTSVVEMTKRRESSAFILGGLCRRKTCTDQSCVTSGCKGTCKPDVTLTTFQEEDDTLVEILKEAVAGNKGAKIQWNHTLGSLDSLPVLVGQSYDLLFLDTRHNATRLSQELEAYAPRIQKYIVIHDTHLYGSKGEDGKPGLMFAIRNFLQANPQWFIMSHTHEQYGLTVLSCLEDKKPKEVIKPWLPMDFEGKPCGPGTQLKKSLALVGISATENCSCNARAAQMNVWGPSVCRENIETILDWLKEEADKRGLGATFLRPVVRMMVLRAIRAAEKEGNCF